MINKNFWISEECYVETPIYYPTMCKFQNWKFSQTYKYDDLRPCFYFHGESLSRSCRGASVSPRAHRRYQSHVERAAASWEVQALSLWLIVQQQLVFQHKPISLPGCHQLLVLRHNTKINIILCITFVDTQRDFRVINLSLYRINFPENLRLSNLYSLYAFITNTIQQLKYVCRIAAICWQEMYVLHVCCMEMHNIKFTFFLSNFPSFLPSLVYILPLDSSCFRFLTCLFMY